MNKWILAAVLTAVAVAPTQAHPRKSHHALRHHAHASVVPQPDSVTLEGKEYKVCKAGMQDDCVEPRQAGLNFGNRPTDDFHPGKDQHP